MRSPSLTESESDRGFIAISSSRWVLILLGAICSVLVPFAEPAGGVCAAADVQAARVVDESVSLTEISRRVRAVLRRHAVASSADEKTNAVTELCDMFACVRCDPRYATSGILQKDAVKLRLRLLKIAKEHSIQLRRSKVERPADLDQQIDALLLRNQADPESTAEWSGPTESNADVGSNLGAAAAGTLDNGWQLIGLIQRVVRPDFWEPVGGNGTIQYFAMRRVLVVRATTDVHEDVRDLLRALR